MISYSEDKMKVVKISHIYNISRPRPIYQDIDIDLLNTKSVSVWWCLYVLGSTYATFRAQFMKTLSNNEDDQN